MTFPTPPDDQVEIKDFTIKEKRTKFKIDGDIFEATAIMSIPLMQGMVGVSKGVGALSELEGDDLDAKLQGFYQIFDQVLVPASAARFRERLEADSRSEDALDARRQVIPILYHLLEVFGVRPTQQSSDSSTGSPSETDGITSTDGASPEASALVTSTAPSS